MATPALLEFALVVVILAAFIVPLGRYMNQIYEGDIPSWLRWLTSVEQVIYKLIGVQPAQNTSWKRYALDLLVFNGIGLVTLLALQLLQGYLPMNPDHLHTVGIWTAVNTAVSFVTNTNWQGYSGESTMSMFTQMVGLGVQNFLSAATGMAVIVALARAFRSKTAQAIGNFWVDVTRSTIYILIPISVIVALILVSQGVVQTYGGYEHVTGLDGSEHVIPVGPVASQVAIKQIGTNGGGYYGLNSAHPLENPTPLSNIVQLISILLIPVATPYMYGRMVGSTKHGWIITGVMSVIVIAGFGVAYWSETTSSASMGLTSMMEGKEVRNGIGCSVTWSAFTTAASNGSVNAMHDSMSPLAGMVQMFNMQIGEVAFGGVGAGMYGMLVFVILTVFIAGLMVGRTPEYLGKKIEAFEVRMAAIAVLAPAATVLGFTALGSVVPSGLAAVFNKGPHGFSEILYAFSSAAGNNGSAFGGYGAATDFVNICTSMAMLVGRYLVIIPMLAIAGSVAVKRTSEVSSGTFRTDQLLFGVLLFAVIIIIGALTFLPALSLGPIAEHILLQMGRTF